MDRFLQPTVRLCLLVLLACMLLAPAACGLTEKTATSDTPGGGALAPESVAEGFFEDLRSALQDRQLANDNQRGVWVERLANYFAPSERNDQRIALRSALDSFVNGLGELEPNEQLTMQLRFDGVEKISETGDRAMVRLLNGSIYVLITRTTDSGVLTLYEDNVPLNTIIGDPNGAVPVMRIGRVWYLTEG